MDYPHLPYHPDNDVFVPRHLSVACCPADPPPPLPSCFSAWKHPRVLEDYQLPQCMWEVCGETTTAMRKRSCPFGDGVLRLQDAVLAGGGGTWADRNNGRGARRGGGGRIAHG